MLEKAAPSDDRDAAKYVSTDCLFTNVSPIELPSYRFHFDALAHDNDAESYSVENTIIVPDDSGDETPSPVVLVGTQKVKKFNIPTPDDIRIYLALYRVESKNVDLVMSMNVPLLSSDGQTVSDKDQLAAKQVFDTAAQSLRIVDFALFV